MTRTEAAHTNGALSRGPVTPEGKARSAKNAITHGMNSRDVVLPGELQEEFDSLLADFVRQHRPVGEIEASFVFEMAAARWRIRRLMAMETAVIDHEITRVKNDEENPTPEEYVSCVAFNNLAHGRALSNVYRYENQQRRAYDKALRELNARQNERPHTRPEPAVEPVVQNEPDEAVVKQVLYALIGEVAPEFRSEAFLDTCCKAVKQFETPAAITRAAG